MQAIAEALRPPEVVDRTPSTAGSWTADLGTSLPAGAPPLARYEAKYVIPTRLAPLIRDFIRPFCGPDRHGRGDPPAYTNTTLQLDSADLTLLQSQKWGDADRFKLRARRYTQDGSGPVILEIKRKVAGQIIKSRVQVQASAWSEALCRDVDPALRFPSAREVKTYAEFVGLLRRVGARPTVLLRYEREAYLGLLDDYARVTFDRRLCYQPTRSWTGWGREGRWRRMDHDAGMRRPFAAEILELKTGTCVPFWMSDLVRRFRLVRIGFSKYASAMALESRFWPQG